MTTAPLAPRGGPGSDPADAASEVLVVLVGVVRRFGAVVALDGVDLTIRRGDRIALVGPNGAGKTTAIRIVTGYVEPDRGEVRVTAGVRIGYLPEHAPVPVELTVDEFLRARARLKAVPRRARAAAIATACAAVGLGEVRRQVIGTLSKGFRQRVGLADALLGDPAVLVLDEPTAGLDPVQVGELRGHLRALAPARALVLSTHALGELDGLVTRVVVIQGGRVIADEPVEALRARWSGAPLAEAVLATLEARR